MVILKYFERLEFINDCIKRKATGKPENFAKKIGYSTSMLREDLEDLKILGADIKFSRIRNSYFYNNHFNLTIIIEKDKMNEIKGGKNIFNFFLRANNIVTKLFMFEL
jgi:hypothetical protein